MRVPALGLMMGCIMFGHAAMAVDASTQKSVPYSGVGMEAGTSIAAQLNQCIAKKLDAEKMGKFQAWAEKESIKIKALCNEGKRDEAQQSQEKLSQALHEKEEMKIIKACSDAAQAKLSPEEKKNFNAQTNALFQQAETRKHHPCDPVPAS